MSNNAIGAPNGNTNRIFFKNGFFIRYAKTNFTFVGLNFKKDNGRVTVSYISMDILRDLMYESILPDVYDIAPLASGVMNITTILSQIKESSLPFVKHVSHLLLVLLFSAVRNLLAVPKFSDFLFDDMFDYVLDLFVGSVNAQRPTPEELEVERAMFDYLARAASAKVKRKKTGEEDLDAELFASEPIDEQPMEAAPLSPDFMPPEDEFVPVAFGMDEASPELEKCVPDAYTACDLPQFHHSHQKHPHSVSYHLAKAFELTLDSCKGIFTPILSEAVSFWALLTSLDVAFGTSSILFPVCVTLLTLVATTPFSRIEIPMTCAMYLVKLYAFIMQSREPQAVDASIFNGPNAAMLAAPLFPNLSSEALQASPIVPLPMKAAVEVVSPVTVANPVALVDNKVDPAMASLHSQFRLEDATIPARVPNDVESLDRRVVSLETLLGMRNQPTII